jgi:hypothetical protein
VLLQPQQVLDLCIKPAYAADLEAGRALERRHRLHIDGNRADVTAFLTSKKPSLLASPEAFDTMLTVQSSASATLYEGFIGVLNKVFTAPGGTTYFEFTDPALADDFQAYLADTTKTGEDAHSQFATLWKKQSLTGFQGVFLVDLRPATETAIGGLDGIPLGPPEPFFSYVPSSTIHDMKVVGNRIEYLILTAPDPNGGTEYFCWDAQFCHRVQTINGVLTVIEALRTEHGRGRVPATLVTTKMHDPARPVIRTSAIEKSLNRADDYLLDYNWVRLGNAYHANPIRWSYGVDCDYVPYLSPEQILGGATAQACTAGRCATSLQGEYDCPRCNSQGKRIPVGPDKVYIVKPAPQGETSVVDPGPTGYIVPDLTSLTHLVTSYKEGESAIERAVLGKSGILELQSKVESGLAKQADLGPLTDRLNDRGVDSIVAQKDIFDLMASYRYEDAFKASQMSRGRKYHFFDVQQVTAEFIEAKKGNADAGYLYSLLEDGIYAKFADDPMELQRNLLKLELTPAPHLTSKEALAQGYIGLNDLIQKDFINDFFSRFERENGSILEFGAVISHQAKIAAIQKEFTRYVTEKRE